MGNVPFAGNQTKHYQLTMTTRAVQVDVRVVSVLEASSVILAILVLECLRMSLQGSTAPLSILPNPRENNNPFVKSP
jgi:hypothetical protein